jgi:putative solute:sodium symporter small subunit
MHPHNKGKTMSDKSSYWNANLRLVTICLVIWFIVSYLFGIILVEPLNSIKIGGYKLGFWFAQQGSIYTFVALIFFYAKRMDKLDREHDVHEDK